MGEFLDYFNEAVAKRFQANDRDFISPLITTTKEYIRKCYIEAKPPVFKREVYSKIMSFLGYLWQISSDGIKNKSTIIGRVLPTYNFNETATPKVEMPAEYMEVFEAAKKLELSQLFEMQRANRAHHSQVVEHCKYKVAAAGFSLASLIEQIIVLEKALYANKQLARSPEGTSMEDQIEEWVMLLREKTVELILITYSLEGFIKKIEKAFHNDLIQSFIPGKFENKPILVAFKKEIMLLIVIIKKQGFFDEYYQKRGSANKYHYVLGFYEYLQENNLLKPTIDDILTILLEKIIDKAYKRITTVRNRLMELPDSTIAEVYPSLNFYLKTHFKGFEYPDLYKALKKRLKEEESEMIGWNNLNVCLVYQAREDNSDLHEYRTYHPLAQDVYRMRYYSSDPKTKPYGEFAARLGKKPPKKLLALLGLEEEMDAALAQTASKLSIS